MPTSSPRPPYALVPACPQSCARPRGMQHWARQRLPLSLLCAALAASALSGCAHSPAQSTASTRSLAAGRLWEPTLWDHWTTHDERDTRTVDVGPWRDFLSHYVVVDSRGHARVAYARVTPLAHAQLQKWLRQLQLLRPSSLNLREQRAYWLNLYNAAVVDAVLEQHPPAALAPPVVTGGWTSLMSTLGLHNRADDAALSPYTEPRFTIENQSLSLYDIETHILRPRWRDPRSDFALCPARLDAPELNPQPYTAEYLDEQLEAQATRFLNSTAAVRFSAKGELLVSRFFRERAADFADDAQLLSLLREHAQPALSKRLIDVSQIAGSFSDPDLNSAP